ncbi:unnamed protein product [Camellia sinensis]
MPLESKTNMNSYVIVLSSDPYVVLTPGQQVSHTTATSLLSSMAMKSTNL